MRQNLGKLDRVLRFAVGVWFLGPWAPQFPLEWVNWLIFAVGVIALIESFIGWCWLHSVFGIDNKNQ